SLPSLTVVNVSEWAATRRNSEGNLMYKVVGSGGSESEGSLHSFLCLPVLPRKENTCADPALSSASPTSQPTGTKGKGVKLNTAQISPLIGCESPWGSGSLVLWVPNPDYTPHCFSQKRSTSPQYGVKELICLPACPIQKASKVKEKPKDVKKKVRFHPASSPCSRSNREPGASSPGLLDPVSDSTPSGEGQACNIEGTRTGHPSAVTQSKVNPEPEDHTESSTFQPMNRPISFHTVRDRGVKRVSKDAPVSLYKLDNKTGEESVDWDSLRRQAYLWKRHNLRRQIGCRDTACPPGGASVPQGNVGFPHVSKIRPPHHLQSPLSIAPAVWHCMKGIWRYQQGNLPLPSHSKDLLSAASEADTVSSVYSSSTVVNHSSVHRMKTLDPGEKRVREEDIKGTIAPFNSLLHCQHPNQEHQGSESGRSVVQVGHSFPEETNRSANSSFSMTGPVEPWKETSDTDRDPGPKGYQLSTPPPSLSSFKFLFLSVTAGLGVIHQPKLTSQQHPVTTDEGLEDDQHCTVQQQKSYRL
ncbi:hypothetical protein NFI96_020020, partial [Prochilodus magdalenae]